MKPTGRTRRSIHTFFAPLSLVGLAAWRSPVPAASWKPAPTTAERRDLPADLIIDYEIQNAAGAPVTCGGAGAVTIQATVDGVMFPLPCAPTARRGR